MSGKGKKEEPKESDIDCNCYAKQRTRESCPPIRNVTHPLRYYEFTQEEMKALEECDKESFYQRCLPFSTLFAASTYAAVKKGHLSGSPHWGAAPKVAVAVLVGHLLGRVSSIPSCAHRLRDLPSTSYLGNLMRKYSEEASSSGQPPDSKAKKP